MMKLTKFAAAVAAAGCIALGAGAASARVVCNDEGDCWHAHDDFVVAPGLSLNVHPDDWRWEGDRYRWREHDGRGYWRHGAWVDIQ